MAPPKPNPMSGELEINGITLNAFSVLIES